MNENEGGSNRRVCSTSKELSGGMGERAYQNNPVIFFYYTQLSSQYNKRIACRRENTNWKCPQISSPQILVTGGGCKTTPWSLSTSMVPHPQPSQGLCKWQLSLSCSPCSPAGEALGKTQNLPTPRVQTQKLPNPGYRLRTCPHLGYRLRTCPHPGYC